MSKKTNAQLEAELEAANAALAAAKAVNTKLRAVNRGWFSVGMFENERKLQPALDEETRQKMADWNSTAVRFIVPADLHAGDPLWLDLNLRVYDPETCPLKFDPKKKQPDYIAGIRACSPNYAAQQEASYKAATAS